MQKILESICEKLGIDHSLCHLKSVSGGDTNNSYHLQSPQQDYFLKTNTADSYDMFEAESEALTLINQYELIRAPEPVITGKFDQTVFLVLEHISLKTDVNYQKFGTQLAKLHQITGSSFGWHRNNTIGPTLQINEKYDDWSEFWLHNRLQPQIEFAIQDQREIRLINKLHRLTETSVHLLENHPARKSLLHGDLWSGNYASDESNNPVIYDPASYFGDHETDLAMLELFGQPPTVFFQAYNDVFPIRDGYATRKVLYNLYHMLNHLHLFGPQYLASVNNMTNYLLSETS